MQKLLNVLKAQLAGVLATPILQRDPNWSGQFITRHIVTSVATVTSDRLATNVFQLLLTPDTRIGHSRPVLRRQSLLVTNHIANFCGNAPDSIIPRAADLLNRVFSDTG
jgi:hypothetical protein